MSFPQYPEYKERVTAVFEFLPTGWSETRLKRVVDSARPITYGIVQAGENVADGVPYVRPADMSDEKGIKNYESLLRTSNEIAYLYRRSAISSGDIVCSIGPSFGKVMITPSELEGGNLTQGTARVSISVENSNRYYFWVLRSLESFQQWESSVGGATFRALNLGPLAETICPRPPLTEQSQIARFLDHETTKIDALIREQKHLIELLHEKRQAVISHAVTKGLDPDVPMKDSGVEWLGEVPAHWDVERCKFAFKLTSGYAFKSEFFQKIGKGKKVLITPGSFDETGNLYFSDKSTVQYDGPWQSQFELHLGDLVMVLTDLSYKKLILGRAAFVGRKDSLLNQRIAKLEITPDVERSYLWLNLNSEVIREQIKLSASGATVFHTSPEKVGDCWIALPSLEEQKLITTSVKDQNSQVGELIQQVTSAIDLLKERRSALISSAVTGKIDVRNWQPPADESAFDKEVRQAGLEATA